MNSVSRLDIGAGREVHHPKCPRSKLYSQLIMYLGPVERAAYEVVVEEGRLVYKETGVFVHTNEESKWIFVLSTSRSLYIGQVIINRSAFTVLHKYDSCLGTNC